MTPKRKIILTLLLLAAAWFYFSNYTQAGVIGRVPNNLGLVGYWSMNEGNGVKATDFSGQGNTGTLTNGPTWTSGRLGKALSFDGVNDVVDVADSSSLQLPDNATVSVWMKANNSVGFRPFIHKGSAGGNYWLGLSSGVVGYGSEGAVVFTGDGGGIIVETTFVIDDGLWHHVVGNFDGTTAIARVYVDGIQRGSDAYTTPVGTSTAAIEIGKDTSNAYLFNGLIDEVRVYNRALSAAEVKTLYQSGAAKILAPNNLGLVGYWSMNEGTGVKATDFSGNNNTGTLTNGPAWTSGRLGQALSFDGSNDAVVVAHNASLVPTVASFAFWVYTRGDSGAYQNIILKEVPGAYAYQVYLNVTTRKLAFYSDTSSSVESNVAIPLNTWTHIVVVANGASGVFFINGVQVATGNMTVNTSSTGQLSIGAWGASNNTNPFNGLIDEVRVYNRALSAAEVVALYKMGAAKILAPNNLGLVGYWSFNEGAGTTATDFSGNRNTGVLVNGPTWTSGRLGKALSFDGTNDFVNIPSAAPFNIGTGDFTASAWIKHPDNAGNYKIVLSSWVSDPNGGHLLAISNNGGVYAYSGSSLQKDSVLIDDNRWHFISTVRSGTTGTLYVDGISVGSGPIGGNNLSSGTPRIGDRGNGGNPDQLFGGLIDEVRIYNRALSASEVKTLYESR